jgi:hypothetical protein
VVSFTPRPLYRRGKSPGTHWIGGCVGPQPGWTTWRTENSRLYGDSNSDPSAVQPVASRCTDCAIAASSAILYCAEPVKNIASPFYPANKHGSPRHSVHMRCRLNRTDTVEKATNNLHMTKLVIPYFTVSYRMLGEKLWRRWYMLNKYCFT